MIDISQHITLSNCAVRRNDEFLFIKDTINTCVICNEVEGQLHILNPKKIEVDFLKIDGCVFPNNSTEKRCDCGLITSEKLFLVEFKEKVDFSNERSKKRSAAKAKKQLVTTLNNFKVYGINLRNTHAVIALTPMLPHSHKQIISAGRQGEIADFFSKTGCPNLVYGNIIDL